jgi:hypothetical protein
MLLLAAAQAAAASVFTASVDRKELYVNEHVLLTLELRDSDTRLRAAGVDPNVDLSVLTGRFDLGVPRADFRFNIERNRGRSSSTLSVELFPRRAGRLLIPSFSVDGQRSAPIELRVLPLPADASPEVFARSGLSSAALQVREQGLLFLDLYHRVNLKQASFGGQLDSRPKGIEAHPLPATERTERVRGIDYQVTRTAWAISPLAEEAVTLFLPDVWVETAQGRRWRLPVREEHLAVRPLPPGTPPEALIGRPRLEQTLPAAGTASSLVPWEVTLRTATALDLLPAALPVPAAPGLKVYLDPAERRLEPAGDGVDSVATYRGYLMPLEAGRLVTPAVSLSYVENGRLSVATLPGRTLAVAPAPAADTSPTSGEPPPPRRPAGGAGWRLAAGALGALWLATLSLWALRERRRVAKSTPRRPRGRGPRSPRERLLAAFGSRTLEEGLLAWEAEHGRDAALRDQIRLVQRFYYSKDAGIDEQALKRTIDALLARLAGRRPARAAAEPDAWSPRAFRPAARPPSAPPAGATGQNAEG